MDWIRAWAWAYDESCEANSATQGAVHLTWRSNDFTREAALRTPQRFRDLLWRKARASSERLAPKMAVEYLPQIVQRPQNGHALHGRQRLHVGHVFAPNFQS